ncbi:MAG TPA: prolyl oligopeptidase family serine peptidase [Vicinamibacterales bacterium]|nr:prolyl oligopeptidase family serine peptidase [Vicinamibacterales bacterium]
MRAASIRASLGTLTVIVLSLACGGATPSAQAPAPVGTPRPMSLVDLASIPRIVDPQLSPDGKEVIYRLQKADWQADDLVGTTWRQPVTGGAPVQVTEGPDDRLARWSPDGRAISYLSATSGQLFVKPSAGGAAKALPKHATGLVLTNVSSNDPGVSWSADSRYIYFIAKEPAAPAQSGAGHLPIFEQTDFQQYHLWRVDVETGGEEQVTRGDWSVISYRLARDGKHATILRSPTSMVIDHYRSEVWVLDLTNGSMQQVTHNNLYETEAELSPDGTQVYFLTDANEKFEDYYGASLFVAPVNGGPARKLSPSATYVVELANWSADGKSILATANFGVHTEIVRIDVATGATTTLTSGDHQIPIWNAYPSANRMLYLVDDQTTVGGEAWTMPLGGGTPTRVASVYEPYSRQFLLPKQERVTWKGADGVAVEGILFYPTDYQPGHRYPLVVQLHGGPQLSDKFGYGVGVIINYVPVLTGRGYAVLRPNYRGSAGYGPAAYRDIIGHYFNNMHLDVMAGVDEVIRRGVADPDKLAVTGWSAGGTLVNKLITFTTRFKAASSGAGVANWISMMAQTDVQARRASWFQGMPWDKGADLSAYLKQSPISDVSKVTTPTIFFVGERDTRDPKEQSEEMYRGLERNGVPTRLEIPTGARAVHDAGGWVLSQQIGKDNDELAWFEKYIMSRAYTPEAIPGRPAQPR